MREAKQTPLPQSAKVLGVNCSDLLVFLFDAPLSSGPDKLN